MKRSLLQGAGVQEESFKKVKIGIQEKIPPGLTEIQFDKGKMDIKCVKEKDLWIPGGGAVKDKLWEGLSHLQSETDALDKKLKVEFQGEPKKISQAIPAVPVRIQRRRTRMSKRIREKERRMKEINFVDRKFNRKRPNSKLENTKLFVIASMVKGERILLRRTSSTNQIPNIPEQVRSKASCDYPNPPINRSNVFKQESSQQYPKIKVKVERSNPVVKTEFGSTKFLGTNRKPWEGHTQPDLVGQKLTRVKIEPPCLENGQGVPQQFLLTPEEATMLTLFSTSAYQAGGKSKVYSLLTENRRLRAALKAAKEHERITIEALELELKMLQEAHKSKTLPNYQPAIAENRNSLYAREIVTRRRSARNRQSQTS